VYFWKIYLLHGRIFLGFGLQWKFWIINPLHKEINARIKKINFKNGTIKRNDAKGIAYSSMKS
jgi:hypothetical protein